MEIIFIVWFILFTNIVPSPAKSKFAKDIETLLHLLKRRSIMSSEENILDVPKSIEDLPLAEPMHPGHTLLQPSFKMLKSQIKYPQKQVSSLVYGNLDNLGITYGKTNQRILYTDFRKSSDLVNKILNAINEVQENNYERKPAMIIIEIDPAKFDLSQISENYPEVKENENNANEILDDPDNIIGDDYSMETRRKSKKTKSKYKDRDLTFERTSSESSSSSRSSDYEKNPGNPYTVGKDKYKQNWMWNHFMDGDHMNVNPYAPPFSSVGPSGASLFFGRKWWYFNQDDFKPLH